MPYRSASRALRLIGRSAHTPTAPAGAPAPDPFLPMNASLFQTHWSNEAFIGKEWGLADDLVGPGHEVQDGRLGLVAELVRPVPVERVLQPVRWRDDPDLVGGDRGRGVDDGCDRVLTCQLAVGLDAGCNECREGRG